MIIRLSIDLSKIDKSKIKLHEKSGRKFLNLLLMDNRGKPSEYGDDGYLQHDQSKSEREAREEIIFVGNWKWVYRDQPKPAPKAPQSRQAPRGDLEQDDLPTGGFRAGKASDGAGSDEDVPF